MKWLAEIDGEEIFTLGVIVVAVLVLGFFTAAILADKRVECYYISSNCIMAFTPWQADTTVFMSQNIDDVLRVYEQLEHCGKE